MRWLWRLSCAFLGSHEKICRNGPPQRRDMDSFKPRRRRRTPGLSCGRKRERGTRLGRLRARSLTLLFPQPPTEPDGTLSVLSGSPVGTIHRFRITGITPPSPALVLPLWPHALWLAFPAQDYDDHSVTLGLSSRRPSRSSLLPHVRA